MDSNASGNNGNDDKSIVSTRKKEKNYTREEDIFLCRAWVATPEDYEEEEPDQYSMAYSKRVGEKYAALVGNNYVTRVGRSLPQRWSKIRGSVSKFCAIYKSIADQNSDGYAEQDMIKMALLTYKKEKNEHFKFLHCWTELRHSSKWNLIDNSKDQQTNAAQQSSIDEHLSFDDNNDCPMPMPMDMSLEQWDREKIEMQCAEKADDDVVLSPFSNPAPLSSVPMPVFNCSSRVIDFDPDNHTVTGAQTVASEEVKVKKKESNYTREEDVFLCRAWMATGKDLMKGKDESSMAVWERVGAKYASLTRSNYASRTQRSLNTRWHKMRVAVLTFSDIYNSLNDQNLRGYTEHEKISMARVTYKKERKEKFKFHHCWTVLKRSPKWNEMVAGRRSKTVAMCSQGPITGEHFSPEIYYDSPVSIDTSLEQLEEQILEEQQVGCEEIEAISAAPTPPAGVTPLSALYTPVILSRNMDSNTQDHITDDVQTDDSQKVNTRKREKNYTQEEDVFLCRAWMSTNGDPLIEGELSATTLWGKIGEAYAALIGNNHIPRSRCALPNRWTKIRSTVEKFCSIYKDINDQNPSDRTELEKIRMALLSYKKEQKEMFKFLHCWTELRHSPKWNFEMTSGVRYRPCMFPQLTSNNKHLGTNNDENSPMPTPAQPQAPKLVVQKRKAQDVDTSSSDAEELLPQTHDLVRDIVMDEQEVEILAMQKTKGRYSDTGSAEIGKHDLHSHDLVRELLVQKVKKLDEILEIEREKRDTKIMLIDATTLPDGRRQYFEKLQQKILEKVCGIPPQSKEVSSFNS